MFTPNETLKAALRAAVLTGNARFAYELCPEFWDTFSWDVYAPVYEYDRRNWTAMAFLFDIKPNLKRVHIRQQLLPVAVKVLDALIENNFEEE